MKIGYARVSTHHQDLEAQTKALEHLGVDRIYTDVFTGTTRDRSGLSTALETLRAGDILVVHRLDRLGRSVRDLHHIAQEIRAKQAHLQVGTSRYNTDDPVGKMLFTTLAMVAEFEADLISLRTKEGMAIAKAKGRLKGRQSLLTLDQKQLIIKTYREGHHTMQDIANIFGISRSTVSRVISRNGK